MSDRSLEDLDFPSNWDQLGESRPGPTVEDNDPAPDPAATLPLINLLAASWADLVAILAFCTAELLAVKLWGYDVSPAAFAWVAGLALIWWAAAAAVLVVVRRGTPGMLMAGVVLSSQPARQRLPLILGTAVLMALLLGIPALVGARRSPLCAASACALTPAPVP